MLNSDGMLPKKKMVDKVEVLGDIPCVGLERSCKYDDLVVFGKLFDELIASRPVYSDILVFGLVHYFCVK